MNSANQDHKGSVALVGCGITITGIDQFNRGVAAWKDDLEWFMTGPFSRVRFRRGNSAQAFSASPDLAKYRADDFSVHGDMDENYENDVNRLNRYFEDIEKFLNRVQTATLSKQELKLQADRYQTANGRYRRAGLLSLNTEGTLNFLHAKTQFPQFPSQPEFVDIFRKFKLSFNLLAKLKNLVYEPVSQLVHFLFLALHLILEACHWELGKNIAPRVVFPLLSLETCELMQNCLTRKETAIWMRLGEAWRTTPEEWTGLLLAPFMEKTAL